MNKLYQKMYSKKLFTLDNCLKIIKDKQVCLNTLTRLVNKGLLKRLRNSIYHIVPLDDPDFEPEPLHIATLLRKDASISINSSLQAQGLFYDKTIYLYSKHSAKIRINDITYRILKNRHNSGIKKHELKTSYGIYEISITDNERTLIDCIRTRSIKLEELVKIFRNPKIEIDIGKIINYLEKYRKPILYNKTGLVLDACKNFLRLQDDDLGKIRQKLSKKIFYAREKGLTLIRPKYKYYGKWNMMINEDLYDMIVPKTTLSSSRMMFFLCI